MANWQEKLELNTILSDLSDKYDLERLEEPVPEEVKTAIATELKKSRWLVQYASKIENSKSIAETNRVLEKVYDAADRHLVWLGL